MTTLLGEHLATIEAKIAQLTALRDDLCARIPPFGSPEPDRCQPDQICYLVEDAGLSARR